jgi:uncharacterized protein (TIGR03000 family)
MGGYSGGRVGGYYGGHAGGYYGGMYHGAPVGGFPGTFRSPAVPFHSTFPNAYSHNFFAAPSLHTSPYRVTYPAFAKNQFNHQVFFRPVFVRSSPFFGFGLGFPFLSGFGYPFLNGLGYGALGFGGLGYGGFGYGGFGYGGLGYGYDYSNPPIAAVTGYPILSPDAVPPEPAPDAVPEVAPSASSGLSRAANVTVIVPDGADVWFEGNQNSQTGAKREYTSPALEPGYNYILNVRLTPPGGTAKEVKLYIKAGDNFTFDLTK